MNFEFYHFNTKYRMRTMKRTVETLPLVLIALAATFTAGCGRGKGDAVEQQAEETRISVRTQAVRQRDFERRLVVQGTIEAKVFANVAARVGGNLDQIWVDEGDTVKAGETQLFQIDPVARENAVMSAEQDLAVARASLNVAVASEQKAVAEGRKAGLDFARYERLHKDGKVSDHEFESADTLNQQAQAGVAVAAAQVALAGSQVTQAEAALAIARKNLSDTLALAPLSGVVSQRKAEPGEQMAVGDRILTIVNLASVEVAAFVPAAYYGDIVVGETSFRLKVDGSEIGTFVVTQRSPTINPTLRTFEIKGSLASAAGSVVPGSMAEVTLVFEKRMAIGVPTESVLQRGGRMIVFVVRDGRAHQVEVQTGLQNESCVEILQGLETGEQAVTEGQTLLRDGVAVTVQ